MTIQAGETKIESIQILYWNSKKTPAAKGDEIKGFLLRAEADEYKGKATTRYVLQGKDGIITLPNHTVLNNMMFKVPIGRTVRIVYIGKGEASRGRAAPEIYEVYMTADPIQKLNQKTETNLVTETEGKLLVDLKKVDAWDPGAFSELVMKHVGGDIGESFKLIEKLKNEGKIFQTNADKPMWKVT